LAALTIVPNRMATLERLAVKPRITHHVEVWKKMEAVFYLRGFVVSKQEFEFPEAPTLPRLEANLQPVTTDRIDLFFSHPVVKTAIGEHVDESTGLPGLSEVELQWN
jgi:hypothetical protein